MTTRKRVPQLLVVMSLSLAACGDPAAVGPDAPTSTADAALDAVTAACLPGTDRLSLHGAFEVETSSVAYVTSAGKIIGVGGVTAGKSFAFSVRDVVHADVDTLGDHDVAATNLKFLEMTPGSDCATAPAGSCTGFFALAGTYTVIEVQPRYRATFTLSDLSERHDNTNQAGAPLAGTITGCLDVAAP